MKDKEEIYCADRASWRAWLEANHEQKDGIWLIISKKGASLSSVAYSEAVDEALCFGWIDAVVNSRDEESKIQYFAPRKKGSPWSRVNKGKIERLLAEGRMTKPGLAKIEQAKQDGSWELYDEIDQLVIPTDLQAALDNDPEALAHFSAFSPSGKKVILWWIKSAKRPETRSARIEKTVSLAKQNIKAQG
jgi:uncharacterized protein YdeI (YjbR/CyaY-like superfamily)